ncbi:unnamed protein product [Mesocestoides corti]|uniref:non-specific serine/threonine protein kinase n=1 Tax=Mesocestoides corti TaxID=53468 RepID=A0A158QV71_MESCO|nr:unnamed protein product [Mesocestoides corti]
MFNLDLQPCFSPLSRTRSSGGGEYGFPVDWWALGVLVYEMIYGETPFYSDDLVTTYSKIMSHTTSFHLPKDITITPSCLDFIKRLLSPEEVRLGSGTGGADDVRNHPWFAPTWSTTECLPGRVNEPGDEAFFDWTWKTLRSITPGPFHPILTSETDTSYFHDEEETESLEVESGIGTDKNGGDNGSYDDKFEGSQLSFAGFTFSSPNLAPLSSIYSDPVQPQTEVCDASLVDGLEKREVGDGRCSTANSLRIRELEESLARSELQLATAEARFAENLRDAERRVEVARLELASATSLMEAEIAKWKAIAESEHKARQTAEAQKAKAADLLAKRATDMADRLTAGGSITRASVERRQASLPVDMPPDAGDLVPLPATGVTSPHETDPSSSPATELLLKRIQELVERAQQADELLEIERRFSELYKKACEEKEDQLGERDQQITSLNEALEAAKQSMEQSQLAARHALMEEQERSAQYLECLKAEEKSSEAANRRAQIASNEANALREEVQKLREGLSKAQEDFATEKLKCGAAVNKIQQILSGENADALELMMLSEMEATRKNAEVGGNSSSDFLSPATALKTRNAKKFTSQQHLFRQMDRKYKQLARTMFRASQESAQVARNQVVRLSEEVSSLQNQLNAANAALMVATSDNGTSSANAVHLVPAPLGSKGLRNRISRKTTVETGQPTSELIHGADSADDRLPPLESALSPTLLHRVSSLSSPRRPLLITSPSAGGALPQRPPLPANFGFSGRLDVPGKPGRRKKLVWDPRFAKLTCSSLLLWDADKSTEILQQSSTADSSSPSDVNLLSPSTSTLSRKISRQGPSLLLDLPLSAILHVRSVTSCDVLHAPADDLPRIFQVIFDQCEVGGGVRQAALPSAQLPEPRKSSPESSPHCVTPPPKSAPATGILGVSKTLPRKLSFSFSGAFSIASKSSSPLAVAAASPLKVRTNSSGQLLSTACSSDPLFRNLPVPLTLGTSPIPLQGHMLQRIHFRVPAVCELCKRACWHVLSPPPALQCLHCQMKLHLSHLEKRDYILRPCGKSTAILIFRAPCEQIKRSWLNYLLSAIGGGVASTGPGSPLQLTNVPTATTNSYESSTTSSISLCSPVGPPGATHESRPQSLAGAGASSIRSATLPYPSRVTLSSPETTSSPTKLTKEEKEEEEEIFVEPPSPIRDGPSSPKNATPPPTEDPVSETEQHAVVEL